MGCEPEWGDPRRGHSLRRVDTGLGAPANLTDGVLSEPIETLARKRILTDAEGKATLERLSMRSGGVNFGCGQLFS